MRTTNQAGNLPGNGLSRFRSVATTMALGSAVWVTEAAHAVNDLPGGPAVNQLNFAPPVTRIAEEQHWLHWFMMAICAVIFVVVFGVMFYSIIKHRKSVGHKSQELAEPIWVELGWTIVPLLIVIGMALPATKVLVAQKDTTNSDLTIKATGMQWKWGYDYIKGEGEGIGFLSTLDNNQRLMSNSGKPEATDDYLLKVDNPMVVPVGKKVRIITTANDVIHAFMVPSFGIKQDAIPGFVRDTWFRAEKTGDYYGQCAELCGKEHAYMPIHVKVVTAEEYTAWVDAQQKLMAAKADDPNKVWTLADLVKRGESVYAANCAACHQASGKGAGPIKALDGSALVLDADKSELYWPRSEHFDLVLNLNHGQPALLAAVVDSSPDAIVTTDAQGRISSWNRGAADYLQSSPAQALYTPIISPSTSAKVRYLMRLNALEGSGTRMNKEAAGYRAGGKTGTAEKVVDGRYSSEKSLTVFASAFPLDKPRYAMIILVDEPQRENAQSGHTAGWNAGEVTGRVVAQVAPMLGVSPDFNEMIDASLVPVELR